MQSYFILVLLWILFGYLHSFLASDFFKMKMQRLLKSRFKYYRIAYSFFALASLIVVVVYHINMTSVYLWQPSIVENIIGLVFMITGLAFMLSFTKKFFFDLSGADVFLKIKNESIPLLQESLYRFVRHPLYAATLLFIWGIFIYRPLLSNLISCLCITLYTRIGIYFEEKKLVQQFGESYVSYRRSTPMILPFFKLKS